MWCRYNTVDVLHRTHNPVYMYLARQEQVRLSIAYITKPEVD